MKDIFKFSKKNINNILLIIAVSILLAFTNNYLSKKPLPLITQPIEALSDDELLGNTNPNDKITEAKDKDVVQATGTDTLLSQLNQSKENKQVNITKHQQDSLIQLKKDLEVGKIQDKAEKDNTLEKTVTYAQMQKIINNPNFIIIDARSAEDFSKGKIGNSINIFPYDEQSSYFSKIMALPRDKKIVIYCTGGSCDLSHHLAEDLKNFDFHNVYIYNGGWEEWEKKK